MPQLNYNIQEKSTEIRGLREQYVNAVKEMEALNNRSTEEKRSLTPEELAKFNELDARANDLNAQAERAEKIHAQYTNVNLYGSNGNSVSDDPVAGKSVEEREIKDMYERANGSYKEWLLTGQEKHQNEYRSLSDEIMETRSTTTPTTSNTQNMSTDTMGGHLLPHEIFMNELLRGVDKNNIIRQKSRVISYRGAKQLTIPVLASRGDGAKWVGEIEKTPESKMTFGQKSMEAFWNGNPF